ncbi:hypothetical protein D3C81_831900 [compost metagenome]
MGQLDFHPAEQAVGFTWDQLAGQVAVAAEHRQQVTGGVIAGALQQLRATAGGRLVEHARAGVGQGVAVGAEEGHGTHVGLLQGLGGDTLQLRRVVSRQGWRHQRGQLLGNHLAALQQLGLQLALLQPGEVAAQYQRHQAGW